MDYFELLKAALDDPNVRTPAYGRTLALCFVCSDNACHRVFVC